MKLTDLVPAKGTYVGLRVLQPGGKLIRQYCQDNHIEVKKSDFDRRLHTTVIYSRKPGKVVTNDRKHIAAVTSFDLFTNSSTGKNTVLVAKLSTASVVARHLQLMAEHGFTWDYPTFEPHITLSYAFDGDISQLPPFEPHLILGDEYTEELDLDWEK